MILLLPVVDKSEEKDEIFKFYFTKSKSRIAYLEQLTRDIYANYNESVENLKADFIR